MGQFDGKVVLVTGAGSGIGYAIAARFATAGARVLIVDIDGPRAEAAAARLRSEGATVIAATADVGVNTDVEAAINRCEAELGPVDVLVNNAADTTTQQHFLTTDEAWWDHFLQTNLKSQFLTARCIAPGMAKRGGGAIINVSSTAATAAHRGMVAYDASKGGVEALTRALALELAPYNIRVNTLVPGFIATHDEHPDATRRRDETVPLGRGGLAEDLAGPALFLASDDAAYITGTRLVVDGGVLAGQRSPQVDPFPPSQFPGLDEI